MKPKLNRRFIEWALLFTASLAAVSSTSTLASQAATLSLSGSSLSLSNFNQSPQSTASLTNTNTFTAAPNALDAANALGTAEANFISAPSPSVNNDSASLALGQGVSYSGLSQSQAQNLGTFFIEANQSLSFNFGGSLLLQAVADNPSLENANSMGNLSFAVRDSESQYIYGSFDLSGNLATQNNNDSLNLQVGNNITLASPPNLQSAFGGNQESAQASASGSFNYFFTQPTTVTLFALTSNEANAQAVPENPNPIAFVLFGLMGIGIKAWRTRVKG
jgi:hypothetical protein